MSRLNDSSYCRICCSHINHRSSTSLLLLRWQLVDILLLLLRKEASPGAATTTAARRFAGHLSLLPRQSHIRSLVSTAEAPVLHQHGRDQVHSVDFYPAGDYQPLLEFGAIRRGGSKSILLIDEHIDSLSDCLPKMLVSIWNGCTGAAPTAAVGCDGGGFRPSPPKNNWSARLFRHAIHKPNDTGPAISCPNVSRRRATIAHLHTRFAGRNVLRGIVLNFSDVCRTCA